MASLAMEDRRLLAMLVLCMGLVVIHRISPASATCEDGWEPFSNKCYFVSGNYDTWKGARSACQSRGGYLVIIRSAEEQNFIESLLKNRPDKELWIGLTDEEVEGIWIWVDNSLMNSMTDYENWDYGEPNDISNSEDCGELSKLQDSRPNRKWNDLNCNSKRQYVCEKLSSSANTPFPTETTMKYSTTSSAFERQEVQNAKSTLNTIQNILSDTKNLENETAVKSVMDDMGRLLEADVDVLKEGSVAANLLSAVEELSRNIPLTDGKVVLKTSNLVVAARKVDANSSFSGLTLVITTKDETGGQGGKLEADVIDSTVSDDADANTLVLPKTLLKSASGCERVSMTVHSTPRMFEALEEKAENDEPGGDNNTTNATKINSIVMSASVVGCDVKTLQDPVHITLRHANKSAGQPKCVFWNETLQEWSSAGCKVSSASSDHTVCECNHLTSFALLMDLSVRWSSQAQKLAKTMTQHTKALSIVSIVGCSLSFLALILTILVYVCYNPMAPGKSESGSGSGSGGYRGAAKQTNPSKILINLCVALALTNLIFLAGMQEYTFKNNIACRVVPALLHFSLLAAFCWMLVEGFYLYIALVLLVKTHIRYLVLKCSLVGWGVPALIVAITLAINKMDNYGRLSSGICWLKNDAFTGAFMAPVCLILLLNFTAFALVLRVILGRGKKLNRSNSAKAAQQLRGVVGAGILLGLTWVFGLLAIEEAHVAFHYLFAIFNTLQGVFIFLFYTLLKENSREALRRLCCCSQAGSNAVSASSKDTRSE